MLQQFARTNHTIQTPCNKRKYNNEECTISATSTVEANAGYTVRTVYSKRYKKTSSTLNIYIFLYVFRLTQFLLSTALHCTNFCCIVLFFFAYLVLPVFGCVYSCVTVICFLLGTNSSTQGV